MVRSEQNEDKGGNKKLKVEPIQDGVVIDHIKEGEAIEVLKILRIDQKFNHPISLVMNVPSKVLGKKDIVKIENKNLDTEEINKIAIIAPNATINRIRNYKIKEKMQVSLPEKLIGIVSCPNNSCISNKEREPINSTFLLIQENPPILKCKYCEREIGVEDLDDFFSF